MKSHMTHQFSMIPRAEVPRSNFNRTFDHKTTVDSGFLYPILVDEFLPGDTFKVDMTIFGRMTTLAVPFMDNLKATIFFFAVPNRLIWDNWQKLNGEQIDPGDSTDFLVPQIIAPDSKMVSYSPAGGVAQQVECGGIPTGHLFDYMGVPTYVPNLSFSAFWGRAYNLIYNEWFRDENLIDSLPIHRGDGPDSFSDYNLVRRGKRHDYFTSCLPWPQKGPGVELPLTDVPVVGNGRSLGLTDGTNNFGLVTGGAVPYAGLMMQSCSAVYGQDVGTSGVANATKGGVAIGLTTDGDNSGLIALASRVAPTINSLREAFQLQKLYEKDARGGTRYTEIIRAHFGVVSPDARLQRPEFLGSSDAMVNVSAIAQTSASSGATTPQANLAAIGTISVRGGFTKSFTEHGVIIGLLHIGADLTYQEGLNRMWSRRKRFDFYWPTLAHLGEQAVLYKEIWAQGRTLSAGVYTDKYTDVIVSGVTTRYTDESVFGYQERWAEYRYKPSMITAKLRSNSHNPATGAPDTLDVWHLAQKFATIPLLNKDFIEDNPPIERVVAVQDEPQFIIDCYCRMMCARPMPVYSVPGLVDHF